MSNFKNQILIVLAIIYSSILISAYFIQYVLNVPPCQLCYYQRYPYYFATIVIILAFFKKINLKQVFILLLFTSFVSASLSFYHIGIEQSFFDELGSCTSDTKSNNTENLLKELQKQPVISCKNISFQIFGLSLATINFILSIILVLLYGIFLKYEKQNRRNN
ncbi:MAG: disulfide bond formation protein B [Proteobacteria bacterium]|jgi:disulfide bond formation protein DsbB|nr:disulfide bond formation protein B [Pseudomonadota bacterium]MDA0971080.1 disulfide bond formation protein B [Pseudomonadota bacterium]MDA0996325.1 disulfide bond formation protein B [Pseudomonadota bacterium]